MRERNDVIFIFEAKEATINLQILFHINDWPIIIKTGPTIFFNFLFGILELVLALGSWLQKLKSVFLDQLYFLRYIHTFINVSDIFIMLQHLLVKVTVIMRECH